jgi:hypothetical protein
MAVGVVTPHTFWMCRQPGNVRQTIICLNSKFSPTLHSTLEIQPAALFGEKCVRLYL